jgi:uncharacterized protein YjbJ (UPF0337 family)
MTTLNEVKNPATSKDGVRAPEMNWIAAKDKLKKQFGTLTDEDLAFEEGKKEEMLARVQTKIGKSKEELHAIIAAL